MGGGKITVPNSVLVVVVNWDIDQCHTQGTSYSLPVLFTDRVSECEQR